jgi:hypothetical protein
MISQFYRSGRPGTETRPAPPLLPGGRPVLKATTTASPGAWYSITMHYCSMYAAN